MEYFKKTKTQIKLLGALRMMTLNKIFEVYWSGKDKDINEFENNLEGYHIISKTLGILTDTNSVFGDTSSWKDLISGFTDIIIFKDAITEEIDELYGKDIAFIFKLTQLLILLRIISSVLMQLTLKNVPRKRLSYISEERNKGYAVIETIGEVLGEPDYNKAIIEFWDNEFSKKINILCNIIREKTHTKTWSKKIYNLTGDVVNEVFPEYGEIDQRILKSEKLIKDLENCGTGQEYWRDYEKISERILRFLFIPPFTQLKLQVRSSGNYERRDAILPNNLYTGFWSIIRNEFNSRHIVCEFKNSKYNGAKEWLNQLRIYLSKPTIGRFGILFTRNKPSKSLIQAQREAYEQAGILILIIDDNKIKNLIKYKCYLNEPEICLENEKIEFELNY